MHLRIHAVRAVPGEGWRDQGHHAVHQMQPVSMTAPLLRTANDIVEAYRRRVLELGITYSTVDAISGLPDGYTAKLLAPTPMKTMSRKAIELLNGALAMGFVVAVDEVQAKRVERRWVKRKRPFYGVPSMVPSIGKETPVEIQISSELQAQLYDPKLMRDRGLKGNLARNKRLSPWKRRVLARRAARARWNSQAAVCD